MCFLWYNNHLCQFVGCTYLLGFLSKTHRSINSCCQWTKSSDNTVWWNFGQMLQEHDFLIKFWALQGQKQGEHKHGSSKHQMHITTLTWRHGWRRPALSTSLLPWPKPSPSSDEESLFTVHTGLSSCCQNLEPVFIRCQSWLGLVWPLQNQVKYH